MIKKKKKTVSEFISEATLLLGVSDDAAALDILMGAQALGHGKPAWDTLSGWLAGAAARRGREACLSWILSRSGDPDKGPAWGESPLGLAAREGKPGCVRLLLEAGADVEKGTLDGSPLVLAANAAESDGGLECMELLLKAGANPKAGGQDGMTALASAVFSDSGEAVGMLIAAGADMSARCSQLEGSTPAHLAAGFDKPEALAALLMGGADMSAMDDKGETPAMAAARMGSAACMALLEAEELRASARTGRRMKRKMAI